MEATAITPDDDWAWMKYVDRSLAREEEFHFLRFEFLQRLGLTKHQVDLARTKTQLQKSGKATEAELISLQLQLRDYACAIRDYEYLRSKEPMSDSDTTPRKNRLELFFQRQNDFNRPFESHYSWFRNAQSNIDPVRRTVMDLLPVTLTWSSEEKRQRPKEFIGRQRPQQLSSFVDRLVRFTMSMLGGLFLVVPMFIMAVQPTQSKSLIVVSVSVVIFALVLSFAVRVNNSETLISTATYAAFLVVFVGTSGSGPEQS